MDKNTWESWKGIGIGSSILLKREQWDIVEDLAIQPVVSRGEVDKTIRELKIKLPTRSCGGHH